MKLPRQAKNSRVRQHCSNVESLSSFNHIVYLLWCPIECQVRYVGYTDGYPWTRLNCHIAEGRSKIATAKNQWLSLLLGKGLLPTMRVLRNFPTAAEAQAYELQLIKSIGEKRRLVNRAGQAIDKRLRLKSQR